MDNLRTWFVGAAFLVMLIGGIVAFVAGRPIDQLAPFYGIILVYKSCHGLARKLMSSKCRTR